MQGASGPSQWVRKDPVPVRLSGRRHGAAPDDKVQPEASKRRKGQVALRHSEHNALPDSNLGPSSERKAGILRAHLLLYLGASVIDVSSRWVQARGFSLIRKSRGRPRPAMAALTVQFAAALLLYSRS